MRCTAALIGSDVAVTAAHCVAAALAAGGGCRGVWLGFPETAGHATEWMPCERISAASVPDPTLLAPDYAILKLGVATDRPALVVSHEVVDPGAILRMVSVTPDRFYDQAHEVRTRRCVVEAERSHLSFWNASPTASVRVLSSCPVHEGNSGAPLLDTHGRMRGLVHAGGPPFFAVGVMTSTSRLTF